MVLLYHYHSHRHLPYEVLLTLKFIAPYLTEKMANSSGPGVSSLLKNVESGDTVSEQTDMYLDYFKEIKKEEDMRAEKKEEFSNITKSFYNLATDFYEYGWGECFHFAPQNKKERFEEAILRHEYRLALKLGLKPKENVLDLGCGIGGPARNIAIFSQANITGLNYNSYQVDRAKLLTEKAGLEKSVNFIQGDFCKAPLQSDSFDKIYAIEATCHSTDKLKVYGEAYRLLKPGGLFGVYEWCMTGKYDPKNEQHIKIKHDIMEGNSLPLIDTDKGCIEAMKTVGFEILEAEDLNLTSGIPWYTPLLPSWTWGNFRMTPLGRWLTHGSLVTLEALRIVPSGVTRVHKTLCKGADAVVKGGKENVFTPIFFMLVKKPEK